MQEVDCHSSDTEDAGKNYVEVLRDNLHDAFRELLYDAQRQGTTKEYEAAYKKAILYFDDGLAELKGKADEYGKAKVSSQPKEISAIDYEAKRSRQGPCAKGTRGCRNQEQHDPEKCSPNGQKIE